MAATIFFWQSPKFYLFLAAAFSLRLPYILVLFSCGQQFVSFCGCQIISFEATIFFVATESVLFATFFGCCHYFCCWLPFFVIHHNVLHDHWPNGGQTKCDTLTDGMQLNICTRILRRYGPLNYSFHGHARACFLYDGRNKQPQFFSSSFFFSFFSGFIFLLISFLSPPHLFS